MYLVTNEIVLGDAERHYLRNNIQRNMVSFTRNDSVYPVTQTPIVANLTPNVPVKVLHWFIRNQMYEDSADSTYFNNRFNFSNQDYQLPFSSTNTLAQQETNFPIISQTLIYLNGVQLTGLCQSVTLRNQKDGSYYFKFNQPYNHSLCTPDRNIYTYSFCLNPANSQPSGSLDFGQMISRSTFINCSLYSLNNTLVTNAYNMYIYYTGFATVTYSNGLVSQDFGW